MNTAWGLFIVGILGVLLSFVDIFHDKNKADVNIWFWSMVALCAAQHIWG